MSNVVPCVVPWYSGPFERDCVFIWKYLNSIFCPSQWRAAKRIRKCTHIADYCSFSSIKPKGNASFPIMLVGFPHISLTLVIWH